MSTDAPFVSPDVWKGCSADPVPFDGPVYAGLDLSARHDLTALVLVGKVAGTWQVFPHFWTPAQGLEERSRRDRSPYDVWARQGFLRTTPGASVEGRGVIDFAPGTSPPIPGQFSLDLRSKTNGGFAGSIDLVQPGTRGRVFRARSTAITGLVISNATSQAGRRRRWRR